MDDVKREPVNPEPVATRERRYLTIVFSDLVGYTQLSEWMDPEDLRDLQLRYQREALTAMEDYGGYVASYSGDGILVYFGYPTAHENDAERAVRASLDLLKQVPTLKAKAPNGADESLAVRIGVHTGLLVMGPELLSAGRRDIRGGRRGREPRGPPEGRRPGQLGGGDARNARTDRGDVRLAGAGRARDRGLTRPVAVHQIMGARHTAGRTSARMRRGAIQMVGRQREADALLAHWREAVQGRAVPWSRSWARRASARRGWCRISVRDPRLHRAPSFG